MSESSEDAELSKLHRAADFMRAVRLLQAERGKKLTGQSSLSSEQQNAITRAINGSELVKAVKESAKVDLPVNHLAERFEEMARRQGVTVDDALRPDVVKLLAAELWVNQKVLRTPAEKLIGATVQHGAIGPELIHEFERFRDTPGIFAEAVIKWSDPRAFLHKVGGSIDALSQESEFESFRNTPSIFTTAAVHHPGDPCAFLRKMATRIDELAHDPEFERFRVMPGIFTKAAIKCSDPHAWLRKMATHIDELSQEPEFEGVVGSRPSILYEAAYRRPENMRSKLREASSTRRSRSTIASAAGRWTAQEVERQTEICPGAFESK